MPCPPSWEEQMVMRGESAARRLQEEYPLLQKQYHALCEIFACFNISVPSHLSFDHEIPELPQITVNDWPTWEDGDAMEKYSTEVIALFSKLERWLCEVRTILILALDEYKEPMDASIHEKIQEQINFHKVHREEDRKEVANSLRQQIAWYDLALTLEKYESEQQKEEFIAEQQKVIEKLNRLLSHSIDALIRDRSLTEL